MGAFRARRPRAVLAGSLLFVGIVVAMPVLPLGRALDSPSATAATNIGCSNFPNASSADITALKDALVGSNTINLTAGCNYILTTVDNTTFDPTGLPVITGNVTINGNSSVILRSTASGTPIFQILAIASGGSLSVNDLTIGNGGGGNQGPNPDPNEGGGIWNEGTVAVTDTNITNDDCFDGCGIINAGSASVTDSNISSNISYNGGAAITNDNGTMTISNSTIANNFEASGAGALYNDYGTMTISGSTIAGNSAAFSYEIGGIAQDNGTVTMAATILANGPNGNCQSGSFIDKGYNIADDGSCDLSAVGSISNSNDIDGSLGPLGNNGGQTEILLPTVTSPAVGVIPNPTTLNGVSVCPRTDQRGVASAQGANCTIGAVEITPTGTIAGHIYLCSNGTQTTSEVPGGMLGAIGPQSVSTQPNPLEPTTVDAGTYTTTATAPSGYQLSACGTTTNERDPASAGTPERIGGRCLLRHADLAMCRRTPSSRPDRHLRQENLHRPVLRERRGVRHLHPGNTDWVRLGDGREGHHRIGALGKNLFLVGSTKGTRSSFVELAPAPIKSGTFTLS